MPDLSVIIPIYNTPLDMLQRCFQSVLSLKGCDFEALLIDDGSKEAVGDYCKAYAAENPEFRYIRKENGGASSARNLGIAEAAGRYLTFLDADDILIGEPLKENLPEAEGPDMIIFDMLLTQRGTDSVWYGFDCPSGPISRQQFLYQLFTASSISGPCAKLYKTELLRKENLSFDTTFISGEDWMFVCDCGLLTENIAYCKETSYQYFREDSTGLSRTVRFPDKMLQNQLARYERKRRLISTENWTDYAPADILSLSAVELIENLFNSAADLLLAKQYTRERKTLIRDAVAQAGTLLAPPTPKKTLLKHKVLTAFPILLWPLALLRALYLKQK